MNEKRNILPSIYLGIKKFYLKFKKICFFSGVIVAIPILLFLIIFLNKKKIRFGKLRRDVIGHATSELFLYLNKKETESEYSDFFYFDDKFVCNKFLNEILKKNFKFFYFAKHCEFIAKNIKLFNRFYLKMPTNWTKRNQTFDVNDYKIPKEFLFNEYQDNIGKLFLDKIGYTENKKIVTLVVRDNYFKDSLDLNKSWKYHEYRNAAVSSYKDSVEYLISEGFFVIKIGKGSNQEIKIKNQNFYDYSRSSLNSDFLDFWIISKSFFTITTGTGVDEICAVYKVPILDTNFFPVGVIRSGQNYCVSIFKKIVQKKNNIKLNLSEMIKLDKENKKIFQSFSYFQEKEFHDKYYLVDNTADEILDAVKEILERLDNTFKETKTNIEKQKKYWELYNLSGLYDEHVKSKHFKSSIGKKYILENDWLIV